ncbi:MAG: hypothetical protein LBS49_12365, partial [Candidatus Accumulibacter sp.]|nr:hypothetical protein [Accumulibacter sp.]
MPRLSRLARRENPDGRAETGGGPAAGRLPALAGPDPGPGRRVPLAAIPGAASGRGDAAHGAAFRRRFPGFRRTEVLGRTRSHRRHLHRQAQSPGRKRAKPAPAHRWLAGSAPPRRRAGLPPLFVMADQEGGEVSHLSPLVEPLPALAGLLADGAADLEARARAQGERQGRALAALGINMNLSPVVDLKPSGKEDWPDRRTLISRRAIAADPRIVAWVASAYGAGLAASGVLPTVKHFPGLGRVRGDTHFVKASLPSDPVARAADWLPFREVTARTGAAMMLAHVRLPDIDPDAPASLSRALVQDVLRKRGGEGWNYQGILITDDLNMGAVYADGIGQA